MIIKILGSGCSKCIALTENTRQALSSAGKQADIVKVTDFADIASYGVISTPALVIDEKLVSYGKVLKAEEIAGLLP